MPATAKDPDINKGWHLGAASFSEGSKVSGLLKSLIPCYYFRISSGLSDWQQQRAKRGKEGCTVVEWKTVNNVQECPVIK